MKETVFTSEELIRIGSCVSMAIDDMKKARDMGVGSGFACSEIEKLKAIVQKAGEAVKSV